MRANLQLAEVSMPSGCTVDDKIRRVAEGFPQFNNYVDQQISARSYSAWLNSNDKALIAAGLSENEAHLSTRIPIDGLRRARIILEELSNRDLLNCEVFRANEFYEYQRRIKETVFHDDYSTYIFPDEEALIFYVAKALCPKRVLLMGSYYGYWGLWIMPWAAAYGATVEYVDPDPDACKLAQFNLREMGFAANSIVKVDTAENHIAQTSQCYDLIVLDAENPWDLPDPRYRGKRIYFEHIKLAFERLNPGGIVLAHNMLLAHPFADSHFEQQIERNQWAYEEFLPFTRKNFRFCKEFSTTEGVGVYIK